MSRHVPVPLRRIQPAPQASAPVRRPSPAQVRQAVMRQQASAQVQRAVQRTVLARAAELRSALQLDPDYGQTVEFDDDFDRRASEMQRTPSGAQALSIVPQKTGPWSGLNQLGSERPFAPDANNRQTILKLDEWGFPERWTISLGSVYDLVGGANEYKWSARAQITAGSGGAVQEFEVDWMEGTSFSVTANAILINASFNEFSDTSEAPENLRLRATICRGTVPGGTPPTITEEVSATAGNAGNAVVIPKFARAVSVVPFNSAAAGSVFAATTHLQFRTAAGLGFLAGSYTGAQALAMGNRMLIPALSRLFMLTNSGGADVVAKVIFHIEP